MCVCVCVDGRLQLKVFPDEGTYHRGTTVARKAQGAAKPRAVHLPQQVRRLCLMHQNICIGVVGVVYLLPYFLFSHGRRC